MNLLVAAKPKTAKSLTESRRKNKKMTSTEK
jgi:hypothetical protein